MRDSATYGYDALDNLTSTTVTGGIGARTTSPNINATTNRLDSITNGPPGDLADRLERAVGRVTHTYDTFKRRRHQCLATFAQDSVRLLC